MKIASMVFAAALAAGLAGCKSMGPRTAIEDDGQDEGHVRATVLFLADPQIHNVHGGDVKQTMGAADWFSDVAQRHPEMNLLAPYALEGIIQDGLRAPATAPADFMVILGDATNAACTGEFARFTKAVDHVRGGKFLLMAHGNHDSFLMGTINYWQSRLDEADVSGFAGEALPVDKTWWKPATGPGASGWKPLCFESAQAQSVPIHKVQWMAKYLDTLKPGAIGLTLMAQENVTGEFRPFSGKGAPGSLLERLDFKVEGAWIRPELSEHGLLRTYASYLVQAIDVGSAHRLFIIDTSACDVFDAPLVRKPIRYWGQNAGMRGCLGARQLETIKSMLAQNQDGRKPIFAGHFPLEDISSGDLRELVGIMEKASGKEWTYLSAHTHKKQSVLVTPSGGKEINMGSTTDWPMSAYQVRFGQAVTAHRIAGAEPGMDYAAPVSFNSGSELCRHLDAANMLAQWKADRPPAVYRSPGTRQSYRECSRNIGAQENSSEAKLQLATAKIAENMKEEGYRKQMMGLMAAASLHESRTFSFHRWIEDIVDLFIQ